MRNPLPGDRVVSGARIIRHSLISAVLLCSGLAVVGLAQLGGSPASSTTTPQTPSCSQGTTTLTPLGFELAGTHPKTVTATKTVTKWKTATVTRYKTKTACTTRTRTVTATSTVTSYDTVTVHDPTTVTTTTVSTASGSTTTVTKTETETITLPTLTQTITGPTGAPG